MFIHQRIFLSEQQQPASYIYFQYVQVNTFIIYLLVECILKVITLRYCFLDKR